jgi:methionyl aminopeptidase
MGYFRARDAQEKLFEPKTPSEIAVMRRAAAAVCAILARARDSIRIGMPTAELDDIIAIEIKRRGGTPAFKGYRGYPAVSCISIDHELVHGIPSRNRLFQPGQMVSIDVGMFLDGFCGDAATTLLLDDGKWSIDDPRWRLMQVTYHAMMEALPRVRPGVRMGDVSSVIQRYAEEHGYGVVREYVGHAVGRQMHEKPDVPNFGNPGEGVRIIEGLVLCFEPMLSAGDPGTSVLKDGWTVVMADGSLCAHYEHMVAVTETGPVLLTDPEIIQPQRIYGTGTRRPNHNDRDHHRGSSLDDVPCQDR